MSTSLWPCRVPFVGEYSNYDANALALAGRENASMAILIPAGVTNLAWFVRNVQPTPCISQNFGLPQSETGARIGEFVALYAKFALFQIVLACVYVKFRSFSLVSAIVEGWKVLVKRGDRRMSRYANEAPKTTALDKGMDPTYRHHTCKVGSQIRTIASVPVILLTFQLLCRQEKTR